MGVLKQLKNNDVAKNQLWRCDCSDLTMLVIVGFHVVAICIRRNWLHHVAPVLFFSLHPMFFILFFLKKAFYLEEEKQTKKFNNQVGSSDASTGSPYEEVPKS